MAKNKKARTQADRRIFICKRCGKEANEWIVDWRKKPTAVKRVCATCLLHDHQYQMALRENRQYRYHPYF